MVSVSFRARITNTAVPLAIVQVTTKARLAETVRHVRVACASRAALPARSSVMANVSPRVQIISIAVHPAIVRETTKARLAAMALRASRDPASRDV